MLIQNYGLHWERKYLNFGAGRNKGHLKGVAAKNKEIDFREQIGIYVLYDNNFNAVYVGQAGNGHANLFTRLNQHTTDHLWNRWQLFSWFGIRKINGDGSLFVKHSAETNFKCDGASVLNELEGVMIATIEPKLNKQGPKLQSAEQYFQYVDDSVRELHLDDVLEKICDLEQLVKKMGKHK